MASVIKSELDADPYDPYAGDCHAKPSMSSPQQAAEPDHASAAVISHTEYKLCDAKQRTGIVWREGERLEAMDYQDKWYCAKILEIDWDDNTVMVHFDGWNSRFDQWFPMSSDRLRPLSRHLNRTINQRRRMKRKAMFPPLPKGTLDKLSSGHSPSLPDVKKGTAARVTSLVKCERKVSVRSTGQQGYQKSTPSKRPKMIVTGLFSKRKIEAKVATETLCIEGVKDSDREKQTGGEKSLLTTKIHKRLISPPRNHGDLPSSLPNRKVAQQHAEGVAGRVKRHPFIDLALKKERSLSADSCPKIRRRYGPKKDKTIKTEPDTDTIQSSSRPSSADKDSTSSLTKSLKHPIKSPDIPKSDNTIECVSSKRERTKSVGIYEYFGLAVQPKKEFIIEEDHNHFKCMHGGCNKSFRKPSLLDSHIKYYHSQLTDLLPTRRRRRRRNTSSISSSDGERPSQPKIARPVVPPSNSSSVNPSLPTSPIIKETPTLLHAPELIKAEPVEESSCLENKGDITLESLQPTEDKAINVEELATSPITGPSAVGTASTLTHPIAASFVDTDVTANLTAAAAIDEGLDTEDDDINRDEIVNCICCSKEENGLMAQCEVCMCWQHASCFRLTEFTLPHRYVCYVCLNPPRVRDSARYLYHQEWYKEGRLPSLLSRTDMTAMTDNTSLFQRNALMMQLIMAELDNIIAVQHGLKLKLHALRCDDISEIKLWHKQWDKHDKRDEFADININLTSNLPDVTSRDSLASQPPDMLLNGFSLSSSNNVSTACKGVVVSKNLPKNINAENYTYTHTNNMAIEENCDIGKSATVGEAVKDEMASEGNRNEQAWDVTIKNMMNSEKSESLFDKMSADGQGMKLLGDFTLNAVDNVELSRSKDLSQPAGGDIDIVELSRSKDLSQPAGGDIDDVELSRSKDLSQPAGGDIDDVERSISKDLFQPAGGDIDNVELSRSKDLSQPAGGDIDNVELSRSKDLSQPADGDIDNVELSRSKDLSQPAGGDIDNVELSRSKDLSQPAGGDIDNVELSRSKDLSQPGGGDIEFLLTNEHKQQKLDTIKTKQVRVDDSSGMDCIMGPAGDATNNSFLDKISSYSDLNSSSIDKIGSSGDVLNNSSYIEKMSPSADSLDNLPCVSKIRMSKDGSDKSSNSIHRGSLDENSDEYLALMLLELNSSGRDFGVSSRESVDISDEHICEGGDDRALAHLRENVENVELLKRSSHGDCEHSTETGVGKKCPASYTPSRLRTLDCEGIDATATGIDFADQQTLLNSPQNDKSGYRATKMCINSEVNDKSSHKMVDVHNAHSEFQDNFISSENPIYSELTTNRDNEMRPTEDKEDLVLPVAKVDENLIFSSQSDADTEQIAVYVNDAGLDRKPVPQENARQSSPKVDIQPQSSSTVSIQAVSNAVEKRCELLRLTRDMSIKRSLVIEPYTGHGIEDVSGKFSLDRLQHMVENIVDDSVFDDIKEAPFEAVSLDTCRRNLIEHIRLMEDEVVARLDTIERHIDELERVQLGYGGVTEEKVLNLKQSMVRVLEDLPKLELLSIYAS